VHLEGLTVGTIPPNCKALARWGQVVLGEHAGGSEGPATVAAEAIAMVILHRLVEVGWRLEAIPGRAIMAAHGDQRFDVITLLRRLAEGEIGEWTWRLKCVEHGVLDLPLGVKTRAAAELGPVDGEDADLPPTWTPVCWEARLVREVGSIVATAPSFLITYGSMSSRGVAREQRYADMTATQIDILTTRAFVAATEPSTQPQARP
jgi:hypothetical protein